nr:efflux RND transporter permease subunit [Deltaproteobacteria bacterium]
ATLTLPGLGGIVLTIGMAVDANVLVYERIKEELRLGRTAKMAVEAGYKNALPAILDANITTLIAAIVLFQFGTGPVQGFAVTLSIGIVASLFTALVLCRWIQEWLVNYQKIERISI